VVRAALYESSEWLFRNADWHSAPELCAALTSMLNVEKPLRVLDVCAGYGSWASEFRRLATRQGWPVHITGVELFEPRRADLEKWCDEAYCPMDIDLFMDYGSWDIAIGNPHFTALTHDKPERSLPAKLLDLAPAALLLHTQQAFARGEAGRRVWRAYPPAASWMVPGSVKFRSGVNPKCPGCGGMNPPSRVKCGNLVSRRLCHRRLKPWGSDQRCYQVSLWLRGHEGPTALHMLPELDAAARRWTVPPGSEKPSPDLPAAPGWAP
jgi:hypothetical protein